MPLKIKSQAKYSFVLHNSNFTFTRHYQIFESTFRIMENVAILTHEITGGNKHVHLINVLLQTQLWVTPHIKSTL